jgi:phosphonopyruvate decarboxylase
MINADDFLSPARAEGFNFYTGVPCSYLTPLINRVINDPANRYVGAASEGEAVGIAAGAWLAGRQTVVMCQNSGLGNAVNPLTSLNAPFQIPTLLVVTWRGQPGLTDEPQHELMGQITPTLLDTMRIPHMAFPATADDIGPAIAAMSASLSENRLPFAFIMEKGSVYDDGLSETTPPTRPSGARADHRVSADLTTRHNILQRLLAAAPESAAIVASTGKCGRELFTLADRPQHLYQVGSMGCAGPMGLGVALNSTRPVIVLDGDGAALMKLGAFATIGAMGPENLVHVILDNGVHDSTGGQPTVSPSVDFAGVALSCGYAGAALADDPDGFEKAFVVALATPGPHLIHVRIRPGSLDSLGRPTLSPRDIADRFKEFLADPIGTVG